ncbi:hypothetical protein FRB96_002808 [Tulasnella sp. 330]|nr:hypothetical protein FRB96_002808 [Tulasnella sp. 330]KAG8874772.1 hypothetical protein FRB97_005647 [Tulasnella sp. 331]KAG8879744.1 hypothetical protein FRB98_005544 [Tulasnella sp. 332]
MPAAKKQKATPSSKALKKFVIDYSKPASDGVFDGAAFEKFLHDRFKVDGRAGNLGEAVKIKRSGNSIHVDLHIPIAKTYLKYLTKKYLKKNELRDWIRVVASAENKYELRFYNIDKEDEEEE